MGLRKEGERSENKGLSSKAKGWWGYIGMATGTMGRECLGGTTRWHSNSAYNLWPAQARRRWQTAVPLTWNFPAISGM